MKPAAPRPLITLLTDFGARYACGASLKSSFLSLNPIGPLVDLSPAMDPPGNPGRGFHAGRSGGLFSPGAMHLAVVDPGMGLAQEVRKAQDLRGIKLSSELNLLH